MGRLLLLSMFFVASSIQAQDCVEPVAGRTSQVYICANDEPFDLQKEVADALYPTRASEPGGHFVSDNNNSTTPALASRGVIFDPSKDKPGIYWYRVESDNDPTCYDTAQMKVFMAPAPDAGTDGTAEILSTAGPTDLYQFLEGTPEEGGSWNTANGVSFDPAVDESGTYWYTIEKTTPIGGGAASVINKTCTATASVTVNLIEVSETDIALCHNGSTIVVNEHALKAHLRHGDVLGLCGAEAVNTVVSPNPSPANFYFSNNSSMVSKVKVFDFQGGLVKEFKNKGNLSSFDVNLSGLRPGIYFAEVFTPKGKEVLRLIKE